MSSKNSYIDRYTDEGDLYQRLNYGSPAVSKGLRFSNWLLRSGDLIGKKVLCVGCGEGYELVNYIKSGCEAFGTELHSITIPFLKNRVVKAISPHLPFSDDEFAFLTCTEVLEHIEPDLTDQFLLECKRVAKNYFFSIATEPDAFNSHINLHDLPWWYERFILNGFNIKNIQYRPAFEFCSKLSIYSEGITVLADKDIQVD